MIYTITPNGQGVDMEAAMSEFMSIVQMSLRQSDVITRHGNNQVMVLLLETLPSEIEIVTERIEMNWEAKDFSDVCKISLEMDELKG